jgi:adhesin/invasin
MKRTQQVSICALLLACLPALGLAQATKLAITSVNGGSNPTAGTGFTVIVFARDALNNNTNVLSSTQVTLSVVTGSNTLGGTFVGTINALTDSVIISGVTYTKAETVTIQAAVTSGPPLTPDSSTFTVNPGTKSKLTVLTEPGTPTVAGIAFTPQPSVRIEDTYGNLVTSDNSTLVTAARGTGTGTLQGTTSATASGGLATFSNLYYTKAETITINFTGGGVTSTSSGSVVVTPAGASTTTSTVSANRSSILANGIDTTGVNVQLKDQYGNNLTASGGTVQIVASPLGTVSSTTNHNDGTYTATLTASSTSGNTTVSATLNSNPLSNTATVALTAGSISKFAVTMSGGTTPLSSAPKTAGTSFQVRVTAQDNNGNTATSYTGTVTLTSDAWSGQVLATISANGLVDGVTVTPTIAGSRRVTATDGTTFTDNASGSFTVNPGIASTTTSTISANPTSIVANGISTSLITVQLKDAYGNNESASGGTVVISKTLGTISGTTDNANGTYTATLTSATSTGTSTISATLNAVSLTNTASVTFTAGSVTRFAVTMSGGTTPLSAVAKTAGTAFQVRVTAQDANNNTVTTYTGTVNLTSNAWSGSIPAVISSGGLVDGITVTPTIAGSANRTVSASDGAITTGNASGNFTVNPGTASALHVSQQPSPTATAGAVFAQQPRVAVMDAYGNVITSDNSTSVHAQAVDGTGGTLNGTVNVTVAGGVATFTNLSYTKAETIRLAFSSGSLTTDTSNAIAVSAGGATQLVLTRQPSSTAVAGQNFSTQPRVAVEDAQGNVITTDNSTVIQASVVGGTGGTLRGTTGLTAVNGVVTFTDLNYTKMETIRLRFTGGSLTSDTSIAIVVNHGTPTTMTYVSGNNQTAPISTSLSPMVVNIVDAFGNPADSVSIAYSITGTPGGAVGQAVNPASALSGTNGNASSVLTLGNRAGDYTVRATASLSGSPITFTATAQPGAAGRLTIMTAPATSQIAGRNFSPIPSVAIQDAEGNTITTDNSSIVTAVLSQGSGSLQGNTQVQVVSGVAAFSSLSYPLAEQIRVQFTSSTLSPATTSVITVSPDTAYSLLMSQQPPATVTAGSTITPAPQVQLLDRLGNLVSTSGKTVNVAVATGPGGLAGTTSALTDNTGKATFANLHFDAVGGRRLRFTSPALVSVVSDSFTVSPAAPDTLVFIASPSQTTAGVSFATAPVVEVRDPLGNVVTGVPLTVSVGLAAGGPPDGSLIGTASQPVSLTTGQATFPGLSINRVGQYRLTASSFSVPKGTVSNSFGIVPAPAQKLAFVQQPSTVIAGNRIQPSVQVAVQDTFGNVVTSSQDSIRLALVDGGTLLGGGPIQASSGVARFDSVILITSGTSKSLRASALNLTPATSTLFVVRPATPSKLVFSTQPGDGVAGLALSRQPVVTMQDKYSNAVTGVVQQVTLAIKDTATKGAVLLNMPQSVSVDTSTGRAVFTTVAIDKSGRGYTLTALGTTVATIPGETVSDTFAVTAGAATKVRVETLADGTGILLGKQTVSSGTSITVYAVARDAYDNYVSNIAANPGGWTLSIISGGVVAGDLVASGDRRSAVFSGHVIGSAKINVASGTLTGVPSDTLTVVQAGSPTKVVVETADNGTGQRLPAQSVQSGHSIRMYAIARDASNNFVGNIAADWLVIKQGGAIADSDLVASGDARSATFTGHKVGQGQILASTGSLSGVRSDTIKVVPGTAAAVLPVAGSSQSAQVGSAFSTRLRAQVVDSSGNAVSGEVVRFSSPLSGPSCMFGSRQDTSLTSNSVGIAEAPVMVANNVAGTYSDTASVRGGVPALFTLTNTSTGIRSFTITSTNGGRIGTQYAHVEFPVRIAARDSFGNVATGFTGTAVVSSSGSLTTGGGTTPSFVAGVLASYPVMFDTAGFFVMSVRKTGGTESGVSDTIEIDNPAPTVSSISPPNALAGSTVDITIKGTGFIPGVTFVLFSDPHIRTFSPRIDSFTQMTVTVQIDSSITTGPKNVTVANIQPGGGTVVVQNGFTVGNNPVPILTSISPASAARGQSLTVGLRGANFLPGSSTVDFGQGIASTVTVDSATHITADITVSASATLGVRTVTVVNNPPGGGASGGVQFTIKADPTAPPVLASPANGSSVQDGNVTLQWTAPDTSVAAVEAYHVQVASDTLFTTLLLNDSTVTVPSKQVASLTAYSAYFWRVQTLFIGGIRSRFSDRWAFNTYPTQIALGNTVPFPSHASPGEYSSRDYRLLGLPGADNSLLSKYLGTNAGTDWMAYYDTGADSNYFRAYDPGDTTFAFSRGRAFWVIHRGDWTVSGQVNGMAPDLSGRLSIPLHTGWNIITNPTTITVPWPAVQAANGGIGDSIWTYDGTSMSVVQSFAPYGGYYFQNKSSLKSLVIPGAVSLPKAGIAAVSTDSTWSIGMQLREGGITVDRSTWLGVAPDAQAGDDRHDFLKPRSLVQSSQLLFVRPAWDSAAPNFACDIRPRIAKIDSWDFDALIPAATARSLSHTVQFLGIDRVPDLYAVYLIDQKKEVYQDLRKNSSYDFAPVGPSTKFTVVVGLQSEVQNRLAEVGPKEFSLDQNYPNPFNPSTTISLSVPIKANVSLTIYNILGERVKVLNDGPLEPGRHFFQWGGRNGSGVAVSSGVYFYRMSVAGGFTFTRKMLLLK